jgi:hypothetical protein
VWIISFFAWKDCVKGGDIIDQKAFWEELNFGWYQMNIYEYDDYYLPTVSKERKLRLGQ